MSEVTLPPLHDDLRAAITTSLLPDSPGDTLSRNIMLSGPWGCGKSTLLREVIKSLRERNAQARAQAQGRAPYHIIELSVTDLTADGNPRRALLRLLWRQANLNAHQSPASFKNVAKLFKLLAKPAGAMISALAPGGGLVVDGLAEMADFVADAYGQHAEAKKADAERNYVNPFEEVRKDLNKFLRRIADEARADRVLLAIDDLDRVRPEQAVALLDTVYHLFMVPDMAATGGQTRIEQVRDWPLTSIWSVNSSVLEEYFYIAYRNVPSFDPAAYLEKLFSERYVVPPLFHLPSTASAGSDQPTQLWSALNLEDKALARTLAREVNYGALGNLRTHARVRSMCERWWRRAGAGALTAGQRVRDARLLTLAAVFPEFRAHIAYYEGRWPGLVNRLNERWEKPSVELPSNPIYRHLDEPDLHTLLQDLGAVQWRAVETGADTGVASRARFVLNDAGMRLLAAELMEMSKQGL